MIAIIALGNPGEKYNQTRHNVGFMLLDQLAAQYQLNWQSDQKLKAETCNLKFNGESLILAKPNTYMNLSGEAVKSIINFYKIPLEKIIVVFDDVDLELGQTRVRHQGSAGTHNGMKSIIQLCGSSNFSRLKIGIESRGKTSPKEQDLSSFVLSKFGQDELPILKLALQKAEKELIEIISQKST